MKVLEIPYFVEFFFILSSIVFAITLFAILPKLIYEKRALSKPTNSSFWQRGYKNVLENVEKLFETKKKRQLKNVFVYVKNDNTIFKK